MKVHLMSSDRDFDPDRLPALISLSDRPADAGCDVPGEERTAVMPSGTVQ